MKRGNSPEESGTERTLPAEEQRRPRNERPLRNVSCPYCLRLFTPELGANKEHVIARKFVPEGSIKTNDWNLILNACYDCNNIKSQLESEISAITLQPDLVNALDPDLANISRRKAAKVKSSRTGQTVARSAEHVNINGSLAAVASMSFGLVAPPQLNRQSIGELSEKFLRAFFYRITYDQNIQRGSGLPGGRIEWFQWAKRNDWGNVTMRSFAEATFDWKTRLRGIAANGYFKIAIKKPSNEAMVWSFALEWNKSTRIIGFFGDSERALDYVSELALPQLHPLGDGWGYREDVPLEDSNDRMFTCLIDD